MREQGSSSKSKNVKWSLMYDIWGFGVRKMSVSKDVHRIA